MPVGRPRKPTNVLELNGSAKRHPERMAERDAEPKAEDLKPFGPPPPELQGRLLECWWFLVDRALPGTLTQGDEGFMLYAAKVWQHIRYDEFLDVKMGIRFESICARLGMTPADRSRIKVAPPEKKTEHDPESEFAA